MMFATKYKTSKVLIGIFIGSFLNHGLAVAFGTLLGNMIPVYILQMTAGAAFVGFALWTLMSADDEEADEKAQKGRSAIIVVAMAFFVGELGDKTQLTAITLSLDALYPWMILMGTVSGMIVTSSLGIFVGSKIGDRLPETLIKVISSGIFLLFGTMKLLSSTPPYLVNVYTVSVFILVVTSASILLFRTTYTALRGGKLTPYSRAAMALYDYANRIEITADEICRGVKHCGHCEGDKCAVGFIRHLAKEMKTNNYAHDHAEIIKGINYYKGKFSEAKLLKVMEMNEAFLLSHDKDSPGYKEVQMMQDIVQIMIEKERR